MEALLTSKQLMVRLCGCQPISSIPAEGSHEVAGDQALSPALDAQNQPATDDTPASIDNVQTRRCGRWQSR